MSLTQTVAAIVAERGKATLDDLMAALPHFRRDQLQKALQNAQAAHWVTQSVRGYGGRSAVCGVWVPLDYKRPEPQHIPAVPLASVWELGKERKRVSRWPFPFDGGRVFPLLSAGDEPG